VNGMRKGTAMIQLLVSLCMFLALALGATAGPGGKAGTEPARPGATNDDFGDFGDVAGTWTASDKEGRPGHLGFQLATGGNGNIGMGLDRSILVGLTNEQVDSPARVPVRFEIVREAGTITFEGTFRNGRGMGEYAFTPNPEYAKGLARLGIRLERERDDHELLSLALFDVSTGFIRSMQAIGYDETLDKYVAFRIFDVDPEYVRAMASVGFARLSADELVATRVHDVSPEYVRQMRARGENLGLDDLIQSRIFQVTPEFEAEMAKAGVRNLDRETLVQFRIHGVSPEFVRDLRELGYGKVDAQQLVAMKIHGVTPEFIRKVEAAGYRDVPIDKLVQMRIFDIDPGMIDALV
jgi:hypothetical protein